MEYYKLLQLDREPFSNSPDPDYFYQSGQHRVCLQKLELALRLKRGLNVVIGDVGTGKTTLCRQLIRNLSDDSDFETHLILDPSFSTAHEFVKHVHGLICGREPQDDLSDLALKESIKKQLFHKGVDQGKTLVLIIDEGQKINESCIEILRELLNYETNAYKLLQISIFAQLEFTDVINGHANFADRINLLHHLKPMDFKDTRRMVQHRLKLACAASRPRQLFTFPAMWAIYRASKGYPRKVIHLCHQSLLALIIQNRTQAGWGIIRSCRKRIGPAVFPAHRFWLMGSLAAAGLLIIIGMTPEFTAREAHTIPQRSVKSASAPMSADIPGTIAGEDPHQPKALSSPAPGAVSLISPTQIQVAPPAGNGPATETPAPTLAAARADQSPDRFRGPDQAREQSPSANSLDGPPDVLGRLIVKPGDTLVGLVHTVYGHHRSSVLRAVIEANPRIHNPNTIDIGNIITFPAIPAKMKTTNRPCWWIVLDQNTTTLQDAVQKLLALGHEVPLPLQLIAYWSAQSGLGFQIAVKDNYAFENEAVSARSKLPDPIGARSKIVEQWPKDRTYYALPAKIGPALNGF